MIEERRGIDRNQIIGFALLALMFFGYTYFFAPEPEEEVAETTIEQVESSTAEPEADDQPIADVTADPVAPQVDSTAQMAREPKLYTLENDVLRYVFSDDGAQIVEVELKDYQTYEGKPLMIVDHQQSLTGANEGFFDVSQEGQTLTFSQNGNKWTYTLEEGYGLKWSLQAQADDALELTWRQKGLRFEKSFRNEVQYTTTRYWLNDEDDNDYLSQGRDDDESEVNVGWVAHKQQYFSSILTSDQGFNRADMRTMAPMQSDSTYTREFETKLTLVANQGLVSATGMWVHTPNQYYMLRDINKEFTSIIPFGWGIFGWISKGVVVPFFHWLESAGLGYGLIIFIMALFFKVVLSPLTFASYRSMAKMRVLKPEMDAINEKYPEQGDPKKQQEVMALYQKTGVNPLGGCLPQLLGLPILIALFRFFPASFELRQEAFLWATDLSSYDSIFSLPFSIPFYGDHVSLFTILMAISTFLYTRMNNQMSAGAAGNNMMAQQMKIIQYFMPVMLLVWFNNYASGLSYYYFLSNLMVFGQQFIIRRFFLDEDALRAKIEETKAKGGRKKSRFATRMQEAMEQQQETTGNRRMRRMK